MSQKGWRKEDEEGKKKELNQDKKIRLINAKYKIILVYIFIYTSGVTRYK